MIIKNNNTIDSYQKVTTDSTNASKKSAAVNNNAEANLAPQNDTVNLSNEAKLRTQAYTDAMSAPDARAEKVAKLKEQVNSGTYTPNSMRTARAMVADMFTDKALYA